MSKLKTYYFSSIYGNGSNSFFACLYTATNLRVCTNALSFGKLLIAHNRKVVLFLMGHSTFARLEFLF